MQIHTLPAIKQRKKKRLGRGDGSGQGSKSGHGTSRHQSAREKIPLHFEGGQNRLVKKFPYLRGKSKNKSVQDIIPLPTRVLRFFDKGEEVSVKTLYAKGFLPARKGLSVKLYAQGEVPNAVTIQVRVTKGAAELITKAGGTIQS